MTVIRALATTCYRFSMTSLWSTNRCVHPNFIFIALSEKLKSLELDFWSHPSTSAYSILTSKCFEQKLGSEYWSKNTFEFFVQKISLSGQIHTNWGNMLMVANDTFVINTILTHILIALTTAEKGWKFSQRYCGLTRADMELFFNRHLELLPLAPDGDLCFWYLSYISFLLPQYSQLLSPRYHLQFYTSHCRMQNKWVFKLHFYQNQVDMMP